MQGTRSCCLAGTRSRSWSDLARLLNLLVVALALFVPGICAAQDDYFPMPSRNSSGFGFPYPAPSPDEPGVTFNRRYMLDGYPDLDFQPRPQDELWLVSTRQVDASHGSSPNTITNLTCKHAMGNGWNQVPVEQLFDVQRLHSDIPTVVFIHGNRTPEFWARRRGKQAYQVLFGNNPHSLPPVRFVVWSWPSDQIPGPYKDFSRKLERTRVDGQLFGQFLAHFDLERPVTLVAYSLGNQIALQGVETAVNSTRQFASFQLISMAPVTRCDWPASSSDLEFAHKHIRQVRLFQNTDDRALRAFRMFCTLTNRKELVTAAERIVESHPDVVQFDVSESVGKEHNIVGYLSQPGVRRELESLLPR